MNKCDFLSMKKYKEVSWGIGNIGFIKWNRLKKILIYSRWFKFYISLKRED